MESSISKQVDKTMPKDILRALVGLSIIVANFIFYYYESSFPPPETSRGDILAESIISIIICSIYFILIIKIKNRIVKVISLVIGSPFFLYDILVILSGLFVVFGGDFDMSI